MTLLPILRGDALVHAARALSIVMIFLGCMVTASMAQAQAQVVTPDDNVGKGGAIDEGGGWICTECCTSAGNDEAALNECRNMFGCACKVNPEGPGGCASATSMALSGASQAQVKAAGGDIIALMRKASGMRGGKALDRFYRTHSQRLAVMMILNAPARDTLSRFIGRHRQVLANVAAGKGTVPEAALKDLRQVFTVIARSDKGSLSNDLRGSVLPALGDDLAGMPVDKALATFLGRAFR